MTQAGEAVVQEATPTLFPCVRACLRGPSERLRATMNGPGEFLEATLPRVRVSRALFWEQGDARAVTSQGKRLFKVKVGAQGQGRQTRGRRSP